MTRATTHHEDRRSTLLPGLTAHGHYVLFYCLLVVFFAYLVAMGISLLVAWNYMKASTHPMEVYSILAVFFALIVALVIAAFTARHKLKVELRAGYSTLPFSSDRLPIRDPRTGEIVKAAGVRNPIRGFSLSFKRLRAELRR